MSAAYGHTVTDADICCLGVSGDTNRCTSTTRLASASMFRDRIAHGILSASYISTVFGTKLPARLHLPFADPQVQGPRQRSAIRSLPVRRRSGTHARKRKARVRHRCAPSAAGRARGRADIMVPKPGIEAFCTCPGRRREGDRTITCDLGSALDYPAFLAPPERVPGLSVQRKTQRDMRHYEIVFIVHRTSPDGVSGNGRQLPNRSSPRVKAGPSS